VLNGPAFAPATPHGRPSRREPILMEEWPV
jgi:hypothetical protein